MTNNSMRCGRTLWDFCAERPVVLVLTIFLIGISSVGLALTFMTDEFHVRFHIGPHASELANHG